MDKTSSQKGAMHILVLLLILAGLGGLGFLYYNSTYKSSTLIPSSTSQLTLTLNSPTEGEVIKDNKIQVKGKTNPNATVAIYTDSDMNSIEADSYGNFEGIIGLVSGINTVTVTAFAENGDEKSLALDIVNDSSN